MFIFFTGQFCCFFVSLHKLYNYRIWIITRVILTIILVTFVVLLSRINSRSETFGINSAFFKCETSIYWLIHGFGAIGISIHRGYEASIWKTGLLWGTESEMVEITTVSFFFRVKFSKFWSIILFTGRSI